MYTNLVSGKQGERVYKFSRSYFIQVEVIEEPGKKEEG